jgi:type II secretory pathway pseudopilin PulG
MPLRRTEGGFTLLQVMVALVVLAIGVMGLLSAATEGMRMAQGSKETQIAIAAARKKIEEIRAFGSTATNFSTVYTTYNNQAFRVFLDRNGNGVFDTTGNPLTTDLDLLPLQAGDTAQGLVTFLSEPQAFTEWGPTLPAAFCDLNADGDGTDNADGSPHGTPFAYAIKVQIRWQSDFGPRQIDVPTMIPNMQ